LVMGILNITPDSFSDGGVFQTPVQAYDRTMAMVSQGADIVDIGGESSRPGAVPISVDEELARVIPVIQRIRAHSDILISIDTCKAAVMASAIAAGANFINDIRALQGDEALSVAATSQVPICLMHMQGLPTTMQLNPHYPSDIVNEINQFFSARIAACVDAGIALDQLILDPGLGFGKSVRHNSLIVKRLAEFKRHGLPLLLGASRKTFIGAIVDAPTTNRLAGGLAIALYAAMQGGKLIIRTHDVYETNQARCMLNAIITAN